MSIILLFLFLLLLKHNLFQGVLYGNSQLGLLKTVIKSILKIAFEIYDLVF